MTDKDVERVAEAIAVALMNGDEDYWVSHECHVEAARAAIAAHESAVTEIAKLGTVSLTSFDDHCVRIDFPSREYAERMYAALTEGSK
jgi:hypothetical protein